MWYVHTFWNTIIQNVDYTYYDKVNYLEMQNLEKYRCLKAVAMFWLENKFL